jgi:SAM-dependent methyltransferase
VKREHGVNNPSYSADPPRAGAGAATDGHPDAANDVDAGAHPRLGAANAVPWQLEMFNFSLKKRQKLRLLLELLGPLGPERCLLITHGDNPGSINHYLRAAGGEWVWAELEADGIPQMEQLLGDPVHAARPDRLPFDSDEFDRVVVVDAHEHLEDVAPLNREVERVLAPGGVAVFTTPNGNRRLPVSVLKRWLGMSNSTYGHVVQGYTTGELESMMRDAGLQPMGRGAYSRFFTEFAELAINFGYVKLLGRRRDGGRPEPGVIAPRTAGDLNSVNKSYRLYKTVFPAIRTFSALDALVPGSGGYAVAVAARKPALDSGQ